MFRAGEFQQAFGIEPRINYYYYPKGKFKMSMVSNDYKTMAKMAVKYDAYGFLKNHGTTEINTESLLSTAIDIFREDTEEIERMRLYKAVNRYSNILVGNYTNSTTVQAATTTVRFVQFVIKIYNLLVRLKRYNKCTEYEQIIGCISDIDILIRSIPNNINYTEIATMLADLYLNAVIEIDCERTLVALKSDSEE